MNEKNDNPVSPARRRAKWLMMTGVTVLLLGIAGAGLIYWLGTREPDVSGDLSMVGFNRAETRQMERLYGKQGELIEEWSNDLKQPGTQSVLIGIFSVLIASGCFYFARLSDYDAEAASETGINLGNPSK